MKILRCSKLCLACLLFTAGAIICGLLLLFVASPDSIQPIFSANVGVSLKISSLPSTDIGGDSLSKTSAFVPFRAPKWTKNEWERQIHRWTPVQHRGIVILSTFLEWSIYGDLRLYAVGLYHNQGFRNSFSYMVIG